MAFGSAISTGLKPVNTCGPRLESELFELQTASSRINQRLAGPARFENGGFTISIDQIQKMMPPAVNIGRRGFLATGAALSVGSLFASGAKVATTASGQTIDLPGADELVPEKMPTGFSRSEMERRWKKAREWMNIENFDCLLVPAREQGSADVKWLSESVANWVVFPADGQPTLIFRRRQERDEILEKSPIEFDLRVSRFNRSQLLIDRLKELGM